MPRFFNTAGPCKPELHYMLPADARLPEAPGLIAQQAYFVIHAPRQAGKTTAVRGLASRLRAAGEHAALVASCESGQTARDDIAAGVDAVVRAIERQATLDLDPEARPDPAAMVKDIEPESRLLYYLTRWSQRSPRPVVLFLDEIDSLHDDSLISVLRQLRQGFPDRPDAFPHAAALVGVRDVRDYRAALRDDADRGNSLGTASPFNIKVESLSLRDFTAAEVAALYAQHSEETGQPFTPEAAALAYELTRGQPWLVNALARQAVERIVPDRSSAIEPRHLDQAKERLIERRDTHLDSLIDRLREPRVQRVIAPLLAGELLSPEVIDDDLTYVEDLGLVRRGDGGLEIANPIYREVIPRALTDVLETSIPVHRSRYVGADRRLDFAALLDGFRAFWIEHAESFLERAPYSEAAAQLVFMAYLHKIVNGGGFVDREYAVGRRRLDLCVRWPVASGDVERFALELKVWRDGRPDPRNAGLDQIVDYLDRLGLDRGTLIIFDQRGNAPPLPNRCATETREHRGKRVDIVRL